MTSFIGGKSSAAGTSRLAVGVQAATLAGLWTLAVTQPILDVVGSAPTYWIASRAAPTDVILLVCGLTLLPVLGLLIGTYAARVIFFSQAAWDYLTFPFAMTSLLSAAVFYAASLTFGKPTWLVISCTLIGVAGAFLFERSSAARPMFAWSSIAVILVPLNFFLISPTRSVFFSGSESNAGAADERLTLDHPVVLLLFDELSLPVLLTDSGRVDEQLFPNFSRLAGTSTWFRSATANYGGTERSVPSLLTGTLQPHEGASGSYRQHPRSLFSLVKAPTGVFAFESVTHMCPPSLCGDDYADSWELARRVARDLWLVYQNVMVPEFAASKVHPLPERWSNLAETREFAEDGSASVSGPEEIVDFLCGAIRPRRSRSLFFLHVMAPHAPYTRNPDGSQYERAGSYEMIGWHGGQHTWRAEAEFQVVQAYQRYVAQVMDADRLLGKVLARLDETGLFEQSLVIVSSDHGVSFQPGRPRRAFALTEAVLGSNNVVPLFWKAPGQTQGAISDRVAELIDVVPTILEELGGGDTAWFEGKALFSAREDGSRRFENVEYKIDAWSAAREIGKLQRERLDAAETGFPYPAKYIELIGGRVAGSDVDSVPSGAISLDRPEILNELRDFDPSSQNKPNFMQGTISEGSISRIAVVVNGTVADVVEPLLEAGRWRFSSFFDPKLFGEGANRLEFYALNLSATGNPRFSPVVTQDVYFQVVDGQVTDRMGNPLTLAQERLAFSIDNAKVMLPGLVHFSGWIADKKDYSAPLAYMAGYGETTILSRDLRPRPDLVSVSERLKMAGFKLDLPLDGQPFERQKLRLYVIFDHDSFAQVPVLRDSSW